MAEAFLERRRVSEKYMQRLDQGWNRLEAYADGTDFNLLYQGDMTYLVEDWVWGEQVFIHNVTADMASPELVGTINFTNFCPGTSVARAAGAGVPPSEKPTRLTIGRDDGPPTARRRQSPASTAPTSTPTATTCTWRPASGRRPAATRTATATPATTCRRSGT